MNARFLRVAKLNGHHNRWRGKERLGPGRREAREAITQKNYSHSAWKASLRCLDRLMVWWWRRRGGCVIDAEEEDEGVEENWWSWCRGCWSSTAIKAITHWHLHRAHNPTSSGVRWEVTVSKANVETLRKQSKVDKVDFLVWQQPFESRLWPEASLKTFPKAFKNICPVAETFPFQSPDFRLIKLVIVLLSDYSESPNSPPFLATS